MQRPFYTRIWERVPLGIREPVRWGKFRLATSVLKKRIPRQFVLEYFPKHSIGAEAGVWLGDFSALMLQVVEPASLHLIDPWKFEAGPDYQTSRYGKSKGRSQARMDRIHNIVQRRFGRLISMGVIHIHREASADAVAAFSDEYFDWVYLDGNHQYEFVKSDLESFCRKTKSNGLIAGDDYGRRNWPGVTQAVDEFVAKGLCDLVLIKDNQFILRKKSTHA